MNTIRNMILGAALLPMLPAAAQQQAKDSTLNRTVVVENQYNPEVMDAFKVNVLPQIEEPAVAKQHIDYAESQRPLTTWAVAPMGPITRSLTQPVAPRGYIRGAYGNRNNTDFKASYLWNISSRDQLGVMASLYGLCGDIPMLTEEDDWKSRFFRTDFSLDYRHDFKRVALWLGGNFASQVFNYMPASTSSAQLRLFGQTALYLGRRICRCSVYRHIFPGPFRHSDRAAQLQPKVCPDGFMGGL